MGKRLANGDISEEDIHKTLIQWIRVHPQLKGKEKFFIHIPNEGRRSPRYGRLMKDLGLRSGVSDILIAMPCKGFGAAWIELKSKSGVLSPAQKEFLDDMKRQNYFTAVCYSIDEAMKVIEGYCF